MCFAKENNAEIQLSVDEKLNKDQEQNSHLVEYFSRQLDDDEVL